LAVRAGDLEVWTAAVDQTRPELIYSERLDTAFGEIRGRIGWGGPGLVYFAVPRGSRSVILGVSEDGVEALGGTAG
jgi:hypothetical protein